MNNQSASQFRFKPCCLRWHNIAGVSYGDQLFHGDRIKSKGYFHLPAVDSAFKLVKTTDTSDKINTFRPSKILDIEYRGKYFIRQDRNIKDPDRIIIIICAFPCSKTVPPAIEVQRKIMKFPGFIYLRPLFPDNKSLFKFCQELGR